MRVAICCLMVFGTLSSGCSQKPKPEIRFCAKWSEAEKTFSSGDFHQLWSNATHQLKYDELEGASYGKSCVMVIKGVLPLGLIHVRAIKIDSNGIRTNAVILPDSIQNNDVRADLRAMTIYDLEDSDKLISHAESGAYDVDPGRYCILLLKNDVEMASSELIVLESEKSWMRKP